MTTSTDFIEKKILLHAPHDRIWRALTDSREFGAWFGMKLDGPFAAGKTLRGSIAPTTVDVEVAKMQEPYTGKSVELMIERVEPQHLFSFRWHPYAIQPGVDYSDEPTTLVAFALKDVAGGVELTLTESGFDAIPLSRRAKAFAANDGGWQMQVRLIEKYLARAE